MNKRYLEKQVVSDLNKKMVFLAGPRQVGKTTLAENILANEQGSYFNWDDDEDRTKILTKEFPIGKTTIVLDEIHKYKKWRNYLKGLFDKNKHRLKILVTGSARLDLYRRGGDSLQGRYHFLRLYPLSVAELGIKNQNDFKTLLNLSGFPEPYFSGSEEERRRWSKSYRSLLIRDDLQSLEQVREVSSIELLSLRLPKLVGSPLSYNALREDLSVAHLSVVRWCDMLEKLFYIFRLYPFGSPLIKAVKKEAKHYQWDWTLIEDPGYRFENLVAVHLLKWCSYQEDVHGKDFELRYFRDQEGREVDFVMLENKEPIAFIECKLSDRDTSPHLIYLKKKYPEVRSIQLVEVPNIKYQDKNNIEHLSAVEYLAELI